MHLLGEMKTKGPVMALLLGCIAIGVCSGSIAAEPQSGLVKIRVFSLFHPRELQLSAVHGEAAVFEFEGRSQPLTEQSGDLTVHTSDGAVQTSGSTLRIAPDACLRLKAGPLTDPTVQANFWLGVPGKLRRSFRGTLEICAHSGVLEATVTMPLETAVASVVAAESPSDAGIEALKAQAVAARSFLAARQTAHVGFDFCDTTHCQFLRSPPAANSPAAVAALATRGQILVWHDDASAQDKTLAAMYARSCGGHTRTLKEIGIKSSGYPYYAVRCVYCSRHPEVWQRVTAPTIQTEHDRLAFNRIHGWGAIPSLGDSSQDGRVISGKGIGHGLGLCQLGAADMARHGVGYAEILAHYYPNTRLTGVPSL